MTDWEDSAPVSNDYGNDNFSSCNDGGGGKSFGKGRGFTPQGVNSGSDYRGGRGGGRYGDDNRGGGGYRGNRDGDDSRGGGYRGNRDRNGDDSWAGGGGGYRGNRDRNGANRDRNGADNWGGGSQNQDQTDNWSSNNGDGGNRRGDRGGGGGGRYRRNDEDGGGGNNDWSNDGGRSRRNNDDNGGGWGGGGRSRDNDGGDGWSNDNRDRDGGGRSRGKGGRGGSRDENGGGFGGGGGCGGDDNEEGEKRPPIYVPKDITDEEIDGQGIGVGINFKDYDNIKINVSGENAPKPIQSFEQAGLRSLILDNLRYFKYSSPTPVQKYAIPIIRHSRDLMATAQTGSGKTAAYLLPIIDRLLENPSESSGGSSSSPRALILSPTRELTTQIYMEAKKFCRSSYMKVGQIYGGTAVSYQSKKLLDGCDILVATPGRLGDFLNRGFINFSNLQFFVLDEADRMLDMGFRSEIEKFFNHESISSRDRRQTLMFSATFDQEIQKLACTYLTDYIFLAVGIVGGACKDVEQVFIQAERREKQKKLLELLRNERSLKGTLIFVETKRTADFTASYLSEQDFPTTSIHGDRFQEQRETALREFKAGTKDILVATSVAARGLDIKGVKHVVNFDLPKEIDEYVHRIGRTGRLGNKGKATSFYDSSNDSNLASSLVTILKQANQTVPEWLENDATGASGYNGAEFGAHDYRSNRGGAFQSGAQPQAIEAGAPEEAW